MWSVVSKVGVAGMEGPNGGVWACLVSAGPRNESEDNNKNDDRLFSDKSQYIVNIRQRRGTPTQLPPKESKSK
jgi:hypothetical protein